ncbi:metal ABC transporter substrate-binding protein [Kineococcus sp. SYSU DK004]|uniref:metal ABC transporter substrate-binding protein n=1 Tax=Kineococcus sp. SYSU DK004 TaxID=3383125 RepID=UPI003D7E40C5
MTPRTPAPLSRRAALLAGAALLAVPAGGCGAAGGPGSSAGSDATTVVASSYPLAFVVERVAAERIGSGDVALENLVPPGADSHDLELSPQQVAELGAADLVVHLGGLQPAVDSALAQDPPEHLVDTAPLADLGADPHFWLDPVRMVEVTREVAGELAHVDPDGAGSYTSAAADLEEDLRALDAEYSEALAGCAGATLVTSHEAFGYLAERYGLEQLGITGIDPHVEPSPARLRQVVQTVSGRGVQTVFFEAAAGEGVAAALADDLGVRTGVLHPIERVTRDEDYLGLMEANLAALRDGLACDA